MTRETRIGLLVGLVFIVMFGLVLSGLTENKNPLPNKPAVAVDNNYAAQTLMAYEDTAAPVPAVAPGSSAPIAPRTSEMMASTATPESGPATIVHTSLAPLPPDPAVPVIRTAMAGGGSSTPTPPAILAPTPGPEPVLPPVVDPPSVASSGGGRVYIVEDKDSFIKIARKLYGPEHTAEYKKIMDANKDKVKDAAALKPGMSITIPTLAGVPVPPATPAVRGTSTVAPRTGTTTQPVRATLVAPQPTPMPAAVRVSLGGPTSPTVGTGRVPVMGDPGHPIPMLARAPTTAPAPVAPVAVASSGRTYVVQKGDTVSSIARRQLSSDSRANIERILKLNKIDSAEKLQVGAKLEIPS